MFIIYQSLKNTFIFGIFLKINNQYVYTNEIACISTIPRHISICEVYILWTIIQKTY